MSQIGELQKRLGVPETDKWDTPTQAAVTAYQVASALPPTGLPTPSTLARLQVYNPLSLSRLGGQSKDEAGSGNKARISILTSLNQVPWYVYLGVGALSFGFAALAIHRKNKA